MAHAWIAELKPSPPEKRLEVGLTYIYGIGQLEVAQDLARALGLSLDTKRCDLTEEERFAEAPRPHRRGYQVEGDLRRERTRRSSACRRSAPTAAFAIAATCR